MKSCYEDTVMKILLLGKNGQLGYELNHLLCSLTNVADILALDRAIDNQGFCGDVTNFELMKHTIDTYKPDIIINATAYTAVDLAEQEQQKANLVNHLAVAHIAILAKAINCLVIHYSTDYVFGGDGTYPYCENDKTNPLNIYGKTKRQGEIALENSEADFINIRISWVYGHHGNNFIKTMIRLMKEKDVLSVINDQYGAPTCAKWVAYVTISIIDFFIKNKLLKTNRIKPYVGHYHLSPKGQTTWYEFSLLIFDLFKQYHANQLKTTTINPIASSDYKTIAKRPLNSRLNTQKISSTFDIALPNWQDDAIVTIKEILNATTQQSK